MYELVTSRFGCVCEGVWGCGVCGCGCDGGGGYVFYAIHIAYVNCNLCLCMISFWKWDENLNLKNAVGQLYLLPDFDMISKLRNFWYQSNKIYLPPTSGRSNGVTSGSTAQYAGEPLLVKATFLTVTSGSLIFWSRMFFFPLSRRIRFCQFYSVKWWQ